MIDTSHADVDPIFQATRFEKCIVLLEKEFFKLFLVNDPTDIAYSPVGSLVR